MKYGFVNDTNIVTVVIMVSWGFPEYPISYDVGILYHDYYHNQYHPICNLISYFNTIYNITPTYHMMSNKIS